jgi:hypothetical protein
LNDFIGYANWLHSGLIKFDEDPSDQEAVYSRFLATIIKGVREPDNMPALDVLSENVDPSILCQVLWLRNLKLNLIGEIGEDQWLSPRLQWLIGFRKAKGLPNTGVWVFSRTSEISACGLEMSRPKSRMLFPATLHTMILQQVSQIPTEKESDAIVPAICPACRRGSVVGVRLVLRRSDPDGVLLPNGHILDIVNCLRRLGREHGDGFNVGFFAYGLSRGDESRGKSGVCGLDDGPARNNGSGCPSDGVGGLEDGACDGGRRGDSSLLDIGIG